MKRIIQLLLLLCFQFSYSRASDLHDLIQKKLDVYQHVGVAISVVKHFQPIYSKGFGFRDLDSKEKINEDTKFALASNTKSFTAMALAILVEHGKIKWTDKVKKYIPEFEMYDEFLTQNFNIQDLLVHRSGLPLGIGDLMFFPDGSKFTINHVIRAFKYFKPTSDFRTSYDYDNSLYLIAGELVKRVSGMEWDKFVEKNIFSPLNMTNSWGMYQNIKNVSNIAEPHTLKSNKITKLETYLKPSPSLAAAGGIYSSANDMTNWMLMHLRRGFINENSKLISKRNHEEIWKPHTSISFDPIGNKDNTHFHSYGLGWHIFDYHSKVIIEHKGVHPGMLSRVIMIPQIGAGVVVLVNLNDGGKLLKSLSNLILDNLLGIVESDYIKEYKQNKSQSNQLSYLDKFWRNYQSQSIPNINRYKGVYKDPWFGNVSISTKNGKLYFASEMSPKLKGDMYLYNTNVFAVKWEYKDMPCDAFVYFEGKQNQISGFRMKAIDPNTDFSFDFHDLNFKKIK
jgi:CubicO group peptidase (beta-lactamase class C family)